jgi:hypothetical protein
MNLESLNSEGVKLWLNPNVNDMTAASLNTAELKVSGKAVTGNYNPAVTAGTSLSAISNAQNANYFRLGNVVYVSGSFRATVTGVSPSVTFDITLPPGTSSTLSDYRSHGSNGNLTSAGFLPLVHKDVTGVGATATFSLTTYNGAAQAAGPFAAVIFNYWLTFVSAI